MSENIKTIDSIHSEFTEALSPILHKFLIQMSELEDQENVSFQLVATMVGFNVQILEIAFMPAAYEAVVDSIAEYTKRLVGKENVEENQIETTH